MSDRIQVLVLTGPVGVGKSAVSQALSDLLVEAGVPHGVVELDALRHCHPSPPGDRFNMALGFRNLAAVAAGYRQAGAGRLILVDIVETRAQVASYEAAIPGARVQVAGLRASLATIQARLGERESGRNLEWHRDRAAELIAQWRACPVADFEIDAERKSPLEVAADVLSAAGWPRL